MNTILKKGLPILAFGLSFACSSNNEHENTLYISQAKFSNYADITLYDGEGTYELSVAASYKVSKNVEVEIEVLDEQALQNFNKEKHTEYVAVPDTAITLSSSTLTIDKNLAFSDNLTVKVKKWDGYVLGNDYAVLLRVKSNNADIAPIKGSDIIVLELRENIVSNAAYAPGATGPRFFPKDRDTPDERNIFGEGMAGKPYGKITVEGKFMFTRTFSVPGNWRADIFTGFGLQILTSPDATMNIRMGDASFVGSYGNLSLNQWHHFAVSVDNGTIACYIDGDLKQTVSYQGSMDASSFGIGGWANNCGLAVDEFRIWKTVRTGKQIKKYMCAVDPNHPDLLAYYKFNESSGKEAKDATPNGHDLITDTNITWLSNVGCP